MKQFEIGKTYMGELGSGYSALFTITKRTEKSIWVKPSIYGKGSIRRKIKFDVRECERIVHEGFYIKADNEKSEEEFKMIAMRQSYFY